MKNILTILFALIFFSALHGQGYQIITHVDTLQSGDVIITQTDISGNIIDKGLAKPGFVFENDTTEIDFTQTGPAENTGDVFVDNIDIPGVDGGFLPQDIVFNPHNGNYYIYGYRKVLVCDADMNVIKTLEISNLDNFSGFYSDYHQRMICVHPSQNKVYCLTLEGVLFEIDQYYNVSELAPAIPNVLIERGTMFCMEAGTNTYAIWYYLMYIDQNEDRETKLFKYVIGGNLSNEEINAEIAYDLDVLPFNNSYRIFVSTDNGIEIYSDQLSYISTIENTLAFDHIQGMNNLLYAHQQGEEKLRVFQAGGAQQQYLYTINYADIRFLLADDNSSKLYFSGYDETSAGVEMIEELGSSAAAQTIVSGYDAIFGLAQNTSYVIASGKADVIYINKTDESYVIRNCSSMGPIYRIASSTIQDTKACAIQPLNGNAIAFSPAQTAVLDIGGQVSALCIKDDKVFAAVHKYNQDGYILVLNASSGKVIDKIQPNFDFNPVDIFCSNDPAIDNDRVYVVYVDMDDEDIISRLMFFDCNNYQLTQPNPPVSIGGGPLEYLITPNGSICLGAKDDRCTDSTYVYFFDFNLNVKADPYYAYQGCVEEFDYIETTDNNYFIWVSRCNNNIYFFEDRIDTIKIEHILGGYNHPLSIAFDPVEALCYCRDLGSNNTLHTIDPSDFSVGGYIVAGFQGEVIHEMFFNPNDSCIYAISENVIFQMDSPGSISNEYDFPKQYICSIDTHRDDDFVFDAVNNVAYFPTYTIGDFYEKALTMVFSFDDGFSTIESKYYIVSDKASQINTYQGLGKHAAYLQEKQNLFEASMLYSNTGVITTHVYPRTLTGNWDWISFPCMPRLGNEGFDSQELLEEISPLPSELSLETKEVGQMKYLTYELNLWYTDEIPNVVSTQGYKYNSNSIVEQTLGVPGVVLDPSTSVPLSSQYENWIGYFLEFRLLPEDAFVGVWDQLTRITTKDWTMFKFNGQWYSSSRITPIQNGDGLIVTTSADCDLIWNYASGPAEEYEFPPTEYFSYNETAEYTPFYFEMDSTEGIMEIALTVNDSCVGAAVVEPGDSIVEVNAYLTGTPSGVPIEVETWSGYKSAKLGSESYSVVDLPTKNRISRKIYTGEHQPYYVLSFKAGETRGDEKLVMLQPPSPNPFTSSTILSFVLKQGANISLTVHDLRGKPVKTLLGGAYTEGLYETAWTGTDASGGKVENGIYIIRLTMDEKIVKNEKVVLIR